MDVDECLTHYEETGDTKFETHIDNNLIIMQFNHYGEACIIHNDCDFKVEPYDLDTWERS